MKLLICAPPLDYLPGELQIRKPKTSSNWKAGPTPRPTNRSDFPPPGGGVIEPWLGRPTEGSATAERRIDGRGKHGHHRRCDWDFGSDFRMGKNSGCHLLECLRLHVLCVGREQITTRNSWSIPFFQESLPSLQKFDFCLSHFFDLDISLNDTIAIMYEVGYIRGIPKVVYILIMCSTIMQFGEYVVPALVGAFQLRIAVTPDIPDIPKKLGRIPKTEGENTSGFCNEKSHKDAFGGDLSRVYVNIFIKVRHSN